jgi:GxxExxY protein
MAEEILFRDKAFAVIGACMAVHKDKGNGFIEPVYQDALEIELELSGIPFDPQRNYPIQDRGRELKHTYTPDLLCFGKSSLSLRRSKPSRTNTEPKCPIISRLHGLSSARLSILARILGWNGSGSSFRSHDLRVP